MNIWQKIKKPKFIFKGVATFLPGMCVPHAWQHQPQFMGKGIRKGFTVDDAAMSCYTTWLRMLISADEHGVKFHLEKGVAEIGPGDSLGVGFAALLSGAESYYALDVVPTAHNVNNLEVFDLMVGYFNDRKACWTDAESPKHRPRVKSCDFPRHILTDDVLSRALNPERVSQIRNAIIALGTDPMQQNYIRYIVPWWKESQYGPHKETVSLVVSMAALEHVDPMKEAYLASFELLVPGGYMASAIDFKSHDTASTWDGHWSYSVFWWNILRGKCAFLINRWPHAWHINEMKKYFEVVIDDVYQRTPYLDTPDYAREFASVLKSDLSIAEAFVVGKKIA